MWAKKQKNHIGLSASKKSCFRVKFSLLIAEFSGYLCKQDCSLNGIVFIQIAPPFLMLSEFTPCPNPPQSTIRNLVLKSVKKCCLKQKTMGFMTHSLNTRFKSVTMRELVDDCHSDFQF